MRRPSRGLGAPRRRSVSRLQLERRVGEAAGGCAAVHEHRRARDVRGAVGQQEADDLRHFLGIGDPAERRELAFAAERLLPGEVRVEGRCPSSACPSSRGARCCSGCAGRSRRPPSGRCGHAGLRGATDEVARKRGRALHRRHVHDRAAPVRQHSSHGHDGSGDRSREQDAQPAVDFSSVTSWRRPGCRCRRC